MFFRRSKYRAKAVVFDGKRFASRKEAARYQVLKLMEKSGKIYGLICQPRFELQPGFEKNGEKFRSITYVADFSYQQIGKTDMVIEDAKGFATEVFKLKRKLFEYRYPNLTLKII